MTTNTQPTRVEDHVVVAGFLIRVPNVSPDPSETRSGEPHAMKRSANNGMITLYGQRSLEFDLSTFKTFGKLRERAKRELELDHNEVSE